MEETGRKAIAEMLARGAARFLVNLGGGVVPEFILATGRRIDLMALLPDGRLWAVEVKCGGKTAGGGIERIWLLSRIMRITISRLHIH